MGLTMNAMEWVTREMAHECKRATERRKGQTLESVVELTQCSRAHAARVLRQCGRQATSGPASRTQQSARRRRSALAVEEEAQTVKIVWQGTCDRRCVPLSKMARSSS